MQRLLSFTLPVLAALLQLPTTATAQPGAFNPPVLDCGKQGEAEILCGIRAPEDFEVTPDGKFLIVANFGRGDDPSLDLLNLATQQFTPLTLEAVAQSGWGQASCT